MAGLMIIFNYAAWAECLGFSLFLFSYQVASVCQGQTDRQASSRCGRGAECLAKVRLGGVNNHSSIPTCRLFRGHADCDRPCYLLTYSLTVLEERRSEVLTGAFWNL